MDLDERIAIAKELIAKREETDRQLADLFGGAPSIPKLTRVCSKCGQSGHTARTYAGADEKPAAPKAT
jgi:thymidine kinase